MAAMNCFCCLGWCLRLCCVGSRKKKMRKREKMAKETALRYAQMVINKFIKQKKKKSIFPVLKKKLFKTFSSQMNDDDDENLKIDRIKTSSTFFVAITNRN